MAWSNSWKGTTIPCITGSLWMGGGHLVHWRVGVGGKALLKTIDAQRANDLGESTGFVFEASYLHQMATDMFSSLFIMLFIQQLFSINTWNLNTVIFVICISMG